MQVFERVLVSLMVDVLVRGTQSTIAITIVATEQLLLTAANYC